jgi:hypothetical protein
VDRVSAHFGGIGGRRLLVFRPPRERPTACLLLFPLSGEGRKSDRHRVQIRSLPLSCPRQTGHGPRKPCSLQVFLANARRPAVRPRDGVLARLDGLHVDSDRASDGHAAIRGTAGQVGCVGARDQCLGGRAPSIDACAAEKLSLDDGVVIPQLWRDPALTRARLRPRSGQNLPPTVPA